MDTTQEAVTEFLKRGGQITQCKPGRAKGIRIMRYRGTRTNSARTRSFRNSHTPMPHLGYALSSWDKFSKK